MVIVNDGEANSLSCIEEEKTVNARIKEEKQHQKRNAHIPDTKSNIENEIVYNVLLDGSRKLGQQVRRVFYLISTDLEGKKIVDRFVQWCVQHPQLALCLLAAVLVTSLPIFMFVAFALSTFVMTITGFLLLEGTLLTITTMIILGVLGALATVLLFCALIGSATYFGVSQFYDMHDNGTKSQRTDLRNIMQKYNKNYISGPDVYTRSNNNSKDRQ